MGWLQARATGWPRAWDRIHKAGDGLSLKSDHLLHALDRAQLLDQQVELRLVVELHDKIAREQAVMGVDIDGSHHDLLVLADDVGDVADDADVVIADDAQRDVVVGTALAAPLRTDDAVAKAALHLGSVGAVGTVDLDAAIDGDEAKHLVAIDGVAAAGEREVDALEALVDDEHVVVLLDLGGGGVGILEVFRALGLALLDLALVDQGLVFVEDAGGVEAPSAIWW